MVGLTPKQAEARTDQSGGLDCAAEQQATVNLTGGWKTYQEIQQESRENGGQGLNQEEFYRIDDDVNEKHAPSRSSGLDSFREFSR